MKKQIDIIVVGCGNMGSSHARAYHRNKGFRLVALVDRNAVNRDNLSMELGGIAQFDDFDTALVAKNPDAVCICTHPDSHAELAIKSLEANCHVFIEKPLATSIIDSEIILEKANDLNKKIVVGYILRVHPSWKKFIEISRTLGKPLVIRMNLNQQSSDGKWNTHLKLMQSVSPIVDCGVHYLDVMCQMTQSKPTSVYAIGARLTDEIKSDMYNYGQLQVKFEDGSIGWYEAGWGPMISEVAVFVKDVIGPKGSVSIIDGYGKDNRETDHIESHTQTNRLKIHLAETTSRGAFKYKDEIIHTEDEPDHQGLCDLEQAFFLNAIINDIDLSQHQHDALNSLKIVLAADESIRTGRVINM